MVYPQHDAGDSAAALAQMPGLKTPDPATTPAWDMYAPLSSAPEVEDGPVVGFSPPATGELDPWASRASGAAIPRAVACESVRTSLLAGVLPACQGTVDGGRKAAWPIGWDHDQQRKVMVAVTRRPAVNAVVDHPLFVWVARGKAAVCVVPHYAIEILGGRTVLLDVFDAETAALDSSRQRQSLIARFAFANGWQYEALTTFPAAVTINTAGWLW